MDTTLVVMAAGIGSRFGGLKQAAPITSDGKGILDFSVYDAQKAGFSKVVFIIRTDIEQDFKRFIGDRIAKRIPVEYVVQDTAILPDGRTKPFGTGHAVLCCKDVVKTPFAIINADDYYGANAFYDICKHLNSAQNGEYAMTAYKLGNTLSNNGTVSRGICEIENGYLSHIVERKTINSAMRDEQSGAQYNAETMVSMNLWGLTCDVFPLLEKEFANFLARADLSKDEYLINDVIFGAITRGVATVKVYQNFDKWYGITYREDLRDIQQAVSELVKKGCYNGL